MTSDQRAKGFNYGIGWPGAVDFPLYQEAEKVANRLRSAVQDASYQAWNADMLLRDVRLSETTTERYRAVQALRAWLTANDPRDSKGDPSPNYSFDEIASVGHTDADAPRQPRRELTGKETGMEGPFVRDTHKPDPIAILGDEGPVHDEPDCIEVRRDMLQALVTAYSAADMSFHWPQRDDIDAVTEAADAALAYFRERGVEAQ